MKCPACATESAAAAALRTVSSYTVHLCPGCGLRYSEPMAHPGAQWYADSEIYREVAWNVPAPAQLWKRWEFRRALQQGLPEGAFVFDIGCGRGDFLYLARERGFRPGGLELNPRLIEVAEEVFGLSGIEAGDIARWQPAAGGVRPAVITAFEVLEHLADPAGFARDCARALAPGGLLIFSVPGFHRRPHWVWSEVDLPPHHLTLWSEEALRQLLQRAGFTDVRVERKPLELNDVLYHVVRRLPGTLRPGPFPKMLRGLCKLLSIALAGPLRLLPGSGGFTLLAAGRKPVSD
jgi:SAM-dependent methyltransferase